MTQLPRTPRRGTLAFASSALRAATGPTPTFGTASPSGELVSHHDDVTRMRVVLGVTTLLWVASAVLDWAVVGLGHAGDLGVLLAWRAAGLVPLLAATARLSRRPPPSPRGLLALGLFAYTGATVATSLMCVAHGGLESPYAHGVTFLLVAKGIAHATTWRHGLALLGIPALAHPVTLLAAATWSPSIRAQLGDGRALVAFGQDLFFLTLTVLALVASQHIVWSTRVALRAARKVGRYQLLRELGRGGMGAVWLAHDRSLGREVALKILLPEVATAPGMIERFERELRATAELGHPNTVRVFDGGVTEDGLWFFAMERLEGETLWALLDREGALPVSRALTLVRQAAHALAEAHARGIVHRDVKPENLFVCSGPPEHVKLLDFGIAHALPHRHGPSITGAGWVIGTPSFMAPEQAAGCSATPASDVYALGAVLYAALTGRPPIEASSPERLMAAHQHEPVLPPSLRMTAALPVELEEILLRAMAKEPARRFASARELADALDALGDLDGGPLPGARRERDDAFERLATTRVARR